MNNNPSIKYLLEKLDLINKKDIEVFSTSTRDNPNIRVLRDQKTGIIFIDDYYTGEKTYEEGKYRGDFSGKLGTTNLDYEDTVDTNRRIETFLKYIGGKTICDFGCGEGEFLFKSKAFAKSLVGIELQRSSIEKLKNVGIKCYSSIHKQKNKFQSVFMFHVLEHLFNPIESLIDIRKHLLEKDGYLIIEVPHAKDFLLNNLKSIEFKNATLWSQHLILHTRNSLQAFLKKAGFNEIMIKGIQRYSLANHLHWLVDKKPSGHTSLLSHFETNQLIDSYEASLQSIDATDTLIAIAKNSK